MITLEDCAKLIRKHHLKEILSEMKKKEQNEIIEAAIQVFGVDAQIDKLEEEANELALALCQKRVKGSSPKRDKAVIEEFADMKIMMMQGEKIFPKDEIDKAVNKKLKKLSKKINKTMTDSPEWQTACIEKLRKDFKIQENTSKELLIEGCNYHTKWQANKRMRFVLKSIEGTKANLITRNTRRDFYTHIDDLILIKSGTNLRKARKKLSDKELLTKSK